MQRLRLSGKTVCFTGGFDAMTRAEAIKAATAAGATVVKNVGKKEPCDMLVMGHTGAGIRRYEAKVAGVEIVKPDRFVEYVQRKQSAPAVVAKSKSIAKKATTSTASSSETSLPWESPKAKPADQTVKFGTIKMSRKEKAAWAAEEAEEAAEDALPWESAAPKKFAKVARPSAGVRVRRQVVRAPKASTSASTNSIKGKTVAFIGEFRFPTPQLSEVAKKCGAKVARYNSRFDGFDILVCGSGAGDKRAAARKEGLPILSELDYLMKAN